MVQHRQKPKTTQNRVTHPSTTQHSLEQLNKRETTQKEQLETQAEDVHRADANRLGWKIFKKARM